MLFKPGESSAALPCLEAELSPVRQSAKRITKSAGFSGYCASFGNHSGHPSNIVASMDC
ncbi:hypothetical protein [Mesorhizobium sp. ES1-4]|uniref:hypothetical protein n=1 Tax=Mesorhizobium sp. ES1-4 TaxID=2876627 RepID=UPI001CCAA290|nr:hypothetical protein [Mesorhizobium sp. ES1-4]MBZ9797813.1 hypothetical protein [Mesorhizobium sp. ES1-4]